MPTPKIEKDVRRFLGRLNYIAHFISKLTTTCDPILHLLKKFEEWKLDWWNMYFDGAVNIYGNRASTMIISLNKILLFTCMNRVNLQSATWTFLGNYTYQFP
ncbi:hypothetical protein Peur_039379 [Populus x canadensis]